MRNKPSKALLSVASKLGWDSQMIQAVMNMPNAVGAVDKSGAKEET